MPIPLLMLAAAGSAASGLATIGSGYMAGKANAANALGAEIEAKLANLRGTQIAERSREDLSAMLGNIEAIRTSRGASLDSPTALAIENTTIEDAYRDEAVQLLSERNRAAAAQQQARGYRTASRWALPISVLQAGGSFASAASYGQAAMGG